jgi:3-isopropylmalate dehydrogenase
MEFSLAVLPGDGVGPAATTQEFNVSRGVGDKLGHGSDLNEGLIGGVATDTPGKALKHETLDLVVGYAGVGSERPIMSDLLRSKRRGE